MSERLIPLALNEFYHIYNRGNSKQTIFKVPSDYNRFLQLLYLSNGTKSFKVRELVEKNIFELIMGEKLVAIGAYCLMPNHFHILLRPLVDGGVSKFMSKLTTGYSMYFNKKYERTGSLFEGKFKSAHADSDEYLKYLFSYIHLNPVKLIQSDWKEVGIINTTEAFEYLETYPYSSFFDYNGIFRQEGSILSKDAFPNYFESPDLFRKEILEWINFKNIVD